MFPSDEIDIFVIYYKFIFRTLSKRKATGRASALSPTHHTHATNRKKTAVIAPTNFFQSEIIIPEKENEKMVVEENLAGQVLQCDKDTIINTSIEENDYESDDNDEIEQVGYVDDEFHVSKKELHRTKETKRKSIESTIR